MSKLILCGEEPSFMGGLFSTEEMREESHSQAKRLAKKYNSDAVNHCKNPEISNIYFHGKLENDMGFDLVNVVSGVIPQLQVGDELDCTAVLPDDVDYDTGIVLEEGKEVDAKIYVGNRPNYYTGDNSGLYCLILYPSEKFDKTNTDTFIWNK